MKDEFNDQVGKKNLLGSSFFPERCPLRLSIWGSLKGRGEGGEADGRTSFGIFFFFFFFFCVPQLYLWGSPLLGEIFAYVTVFF